jgi:hypothetical protein
LVSWFLYRSVRYDRNGQNRATPLLVGLALGALALTRGFAVAAGADRAAACARACSRCRRRRRCATSARPPAPPAGDLVWVMPAALAQPYGNRRSANGWPGTSQLSPAGLDCR